MLWKACRVVFHIIEEIIPYLIKPSRQLPFYRVKSVRVSKFPYFEPLQRAWVILFRQNPTAEKCGKEEFLGSNGTQPVPVPTYSLYTNGIAEHAVQSL